MPKFWTAAWWSEEESNSRPLGVYLLDLITIGRFSFVWREPSRRLRSDLGEPLQDFYSLPHSPRRDSSSGTLVESWNESLQRCFRLLPAPRRSSAIRRFTLAFVCSLTADARVAPFGGREYASA